MNQTATTAPHTAEHTRLAESDAKGWKAWGPYLSERQWGTVREDYSADGDCWNSFPHDHARSRAYRWGEDGLLGICDDQCRMCFALALWNGRDPILKERLFGLTGPEGNHGEDVKEHYFYLDSTPTHSYMRALYKYPIAPYPYAALVEGGRRSRDQRELEIEDTGAFDQGHFDVEAQYAKAGPDDLLIRVVIRNHSDHAADLHALPTLWCRNQWSWGAQNEAGDRPLLRADGEGRVAASHPALGQMEWCVDDASDGTSPELVFTENESNRERLWGVGNTTPYVKDAFHALVVDGQRAAVNPDKRGTKAAAWFALRVPARGRVTLRLRLRACSCGQSQTRSPFDGFDAVFAARQREADAYYDALGHDALSKDEALVARQAAAGLLWSKQFYSYDVERWMAGDPHQPIPPAQRRSGRNSGWEHLNNNDVILMPDKWEYPWYAAWDLAFHSVAVARVDPALAKDQLVLMLREWYMHPSGQIPAYEFAFGDVNPPVHAWAVWRVYKMTGPRGGRDRVFLARCFQKLLINFTWWVNRKDPGGKNLFSGGFLGLDNIGVFDRSQPLPTGGHLEQADGTAWMAFYCGTMLSMALELAREDPAYEDIATKFFEHFISITDAINTLGGTGLWDERDGFYYDQVRLDGAALPLRVRSLVGIVPLLAVEVLESDVVDKLPDFKRRMEWFLANRKDLPWHSTCACAHGGVGSGQSGKRLLAIPTRERLERVVAYLMNETEFLSAHGVRSLSRHHEQEPFVLHVGGREHRVDYTPGESTTGLFGGNSNWRGPIWMPLNFLIIEALERYHHFFGADVEVQIGARRGSLQDAADEIRTRLTRLLLPDDRGVRACFGGDERFMSDPAWRDLLYFHEHFHGDTGRGLGATHQTGWTALLGLLVGRAKQPVESDARGTVTFRKRAPVVARSDSLSQSHV